MRKPVVFVLMLFLAAGLGYGLVRLFTIRFAQGDVYSPYSTLRADGVGSKALYDSLADLMPAERNYKEISQLDRDNGGSGGSAIFFLGLQRGSDDSPDIIDLETLAQDGNRVVVAFVPYWREPEREEDESPSPSPTTTPTPTPEKSGTAIPGKSPKKKKVADLDKPWGYKIAFSPKPFELATTDIAGLEPDLSWHGAAYFDKLEPAWRVLYSCAGKPVIIERNFGRGSVVLAADAYFSSNEALSKERAPGLISALVGNSGRVIFDETHLGVLEHPGVASLVRKYQLDDVVLALMFVAALFVWRNAVAFVPRDRQDAAGEEIVRGFDASAGFVGLLKRNIPMNKLVETCVAEWKRSFGHRTKPAMLAQVESLAAAGEKKPVQTFQAIMQILNEKN